MPLHNVQTSVKGNKLIIEVDISDATVKQAPLSSTGKTKLVGTTGGALPVDGKSGMTFALNVMQK